MDTLGSESSQGDYKHLQNTGSQYRHNKSLISLPQLPADRFQGHNFVPSFFALFLTQVMKTLHSLAHWCLATSPSCSPRHLEYMNTRHFHSDGIPPMSGILCYVGHTCRSLRPRGRRRPGAGGRSPASPWHSSHSPSLHLTPTLNASQDSIICLSKFRVTLLQDRYHIYFFEELPQLEGQKGLSHQPVSCIFRFKNSALCSSYSVGCRIVAS